MATFNTRTITLKIPNTCSRYENSKLRADAYEALIVSANPIRDDYNLSYEDFDYIVEQRKIMETCLANVEYTISKKRKF